MWLRIIYKVKTSDQHKSLVYLKFKMADAADSIRDRKRALNEDDSRQDDEDDEVIGPMPPPPPKQKKKRGNVHFN